MLALQVKSCKHSSKGGYDEYVMGLFDIRYSLICKTNREGHAYVSGVLLNVNDFNDRVSTVESTDLYETIINRDYGTCEVDVVNVDVRYVERPKGEM